MIEISIRKWYNPTASIAVIGLFVTLTCVIAYHLGADVNWDLQNYHFYNGYLYTHGRLITGSLATVQSYLDPMLNSFYYLLISTLTPLQVNLAIAALQSLSLASAFFLSMLVFEGNSYQNKFTLSAIISISALFGPIFWSEIGGTMGDSLLALPVIVSAIFSVKSVAMADAIKQRSIYVAISGVMIGFASGLKFTNMTYAVAMLVALAIVFFLSNLRYKEQLLLLTIFGSAALISFLTTYGPVGWLLWRDFQNPIFPYFNDIFRSPYLEAHVIHDTRWFPRNLIGYLKLPFEFCVRRHQNANSSHLVGMEIPFRTYLYAAIFIFLPFYIISRYEFGASQGRKGYGGLFLVLFFVASFIVWEVMFSYYRYIAALEIIAPLTLVVMLSSFFKDGFDKGGIPVAAAMLVLALSLHSLPDSNWGREPFAASYFGVNKNMLKNYRDSLIVVGYAPMGFVLPYFPSSNGVIGLPERIIGLTQRFQKSYLRKLRNFKGDIYYLSEYNKSLSIVKKHAEYLRRTYNLNIVYDSCKEIKTSIYPVAVCAVTKS